MNILTLEVLYRRFRALAFPRLGKSLGDFPLYDSLFAGVFGRAVGGADLDESEIPVPDAESVAFVASLRARERLNELETEFLAYYNLMQRIEAAWKDRRAR